MAISISFHCLGFIVLAAVFIQTITVVVSMMYLNNVLNTVSRLLAMLLKYATKRLTMCTIY